MESWHDKPLDQLAAALAVDPSCGLAGAEARRRFTADGPNELSKGKAVSALAILASQFHSLVIWVLLGAAAVSILVGELADSIAIMAIVGLNALIGFVQEFRAGKAAAALARLTAPVARIVRDGHTVVIPAREIVRGDLLLLDAGDVVSADARLVEAASLRTNEAALTGESQPVEKRTGTCPPDTALAERHNMAFFGTNVVGGSGRAIVVATGMQTEVGHIANLLETARSGATPMQRRLDHVARRLLWASLAIIAVVFVLGLLRGIAPFELFLSAVSLAVAAVPEGLPAVVTVALALGVQRMVRRNALVRHLPAVETLGCAQVICTDKTGTLTVGEMTVREVITADCIYHVTGEGYLPNGQFLAEDQERPAGGEPALMELLLAAAACNDAELADRDGRPSIIGDPTEAALLVVAGKAAITRPAIEASMPRLVTLPFDSDRKCMSVVRRRDGAALAFVKGAPEVILDRCTAILAATGERSLIAADRAAMAQAGRIMAGDALRVLAVAIRRFPEDTGLPPDTGPEFIERDLTLLGLVGMQDPPRAEARDAVARCRRAGVKTVMITGDHPATARAIGRELGILGAGDNVMLGVELDRLDDRELAAGVPRIAVYARVTAAHKLRIVRAWKSQGAVVAMTGDGVNDAPALKEASIGVAMGITGTEVTKEAADIIVTDDNFASIVAAMEEGRGIYDNIAKTLAYLLAGNMGELVVMLVAALVGWPLPLLPLHLLWINLVTDGLPALALATDPIDPGVLNRPPRRPDAQLMDRAFLRLTVLTGMVTAGVALGAFAWEFYFNDDLAQARDAAFTVLVFAELARSLGARSTTRNLWEMGFFSNLRLLAIVGTSFALQLAIHHNTVLQELFGIEPVSFAECVEWLLLGLVPLLVLELRKVWQGRVKTGWSPGSAT